MVYNLEYYQIVKKCSTKLYSSTSPVVLHCGFSVQVLRHEIKLDRCQRVHRKEKKLKYVIGEKCQLIYSLVLASFLAVLRNSVVLLFESMTERSFCSLNRTPTPEWGWFCSGQLSRFSVSVVIWPLP